MVKQREREIYKITIVGLIANLLLTIGKLLAGIFGRSGAMIADAVHSVSDFATDLVVLFFVKISSKPRDKDHKYGHGKFETFATLIVGAVLFFVGVGILLNSLNLVHDVVNGISIPRPGMIAFVAAAVSVVVKEALFRYTAINGKKVNSPVVVANAWHHRSDAFSSIGTLIGIGGARFLGEQWRILDPIAAIIVSIFILQVSLKLMKPCVNELLEKSLPEEIEKEILEIITLDPDVQDPHNLKTRRIGASVAVEVHIRLNGQMNVEQSHRITVDIEYRLKEKLGQDTQISIHVEPAV